MWDLKRAEIAARFLSNILIKKARGTKHTISDALFTDFGIERNI
jgi:hypothetical protein